MEAILGLEGRGVPRRLREHLAEMLHERIRPHLQHYDFGPGMLLRELLGGDPLTDTPRGPTQEELELRAAEVLSSLDRMMYDPASAKDMERDEECSLCLEEYCKGEELLFLPCKHVYHEACLGPWLVRSLTCPLCKRDLELPPKD